MSADNGITRELGLGEVISKTFDLYRRDFVVYLALFLIVEAIYAVVTEVVRQAASLPSLPTNPTSQQAANWLSANLGTLAAGAASVLIVALVVFPIAEGAAVKMASEEIQNRRSSIAESAKFAASRLLSMWALGIIVGIIVILGLIALVVPGIILAIMFSLVLPSLLLENSGVLGSMGRSRELVSHRWLKTFATFLVLFIVVVIISAVLGAISASFGPASDFVSTLLGAFTAPIFPIAVTVYYYSNLARVAPMQPGQGPATVAPPGMKFCSNCGTQLEAAAVFCPKCGARQPA